MGDAVCLVLRTSALDVEARRKTRTMGRGLATLLHLMTSFRHDTFPWMLVNHNLCRWLVGPRFRSTP